jgi:hypothetical protein
MKKSAERNNAPLYVRWTPDKLAFAIEVRLDVIGRIQKEVESAAGLGIEMGGVFLGRAPHGNAGVLRIDDVQTITRRQEDGPIFMLEPQEHDRFLTTRWDAKGHGRSAVGFFRTHVRPGPLSLSLADRTLVTGHFTKDAMAVLLVQARQPYLAVMFAGVGTALPEEPAISEFAIDEEALRSLPETDSGRPKGSRIGRLLLWALCLVVVLAAAGGIFRYWDELPGLVGGQREIGPSLSASGAPVMTVAWNHTASEIRRASSATLTIIDGATRRELPVGPDELQLGTVQYQPQSDNVTVTLTLNMPDSTTITQSANWHNGLAVAPAGTPEERNAR